jgi:hypothetical protein
MANLGSLNHALLQLPTQETIITWICQSAGAKEENQTPGASKTLPQYVGDLVAIALEMEEQCGTGHLAGDSEAGGDDDQRGTEADRDY